MGQEQSQEVDSRAVPGFNPDHTPGGSRNQQPKAKSKQAPRRAQLNYFAHEHVGDHITAIRQEKDKGKRARDEGELDEDVDLNKLLADLGVKKKDEDDDLTLMNLPDYGEEEEDTDDDDDDDGCRGMYIHEVKEQEKDEKLVTDPLSHPISVTGDVCAGSMLHSVDESPWQLSFPVYEFHWFISSEIGSHTQFEPFPEGTGVEFTIPVDAVGKHIMLTAERRVEDQLQATGLRDIEGGVYDPHILTKTRHTAKGLETKYIKIKSVSVVGPVVISDEAAFTILQSLSAASLSVAVKLRDEPLNATTENDESGGKSRSLKIPALLQLSYDGLEFQYEQPASVSKANSALGGLDWLRHLAKYAKGARGGSPVSTHVAEPDAELIEGPASAQWPLTAITFRPSKMKSCLVMATKLRKVGFSHKKQTQDLIRFDVDPKFGRDTLLFAVMAFQAAVEVNNVSQNKWTESLENGDLDEVKYLVQNFIEGVTETTSVAQPAFESLPTTKWE